ncbi:sugar phosphate isomerase/epimerase family protein [Edaphobacter modestus]|uniref:Sugar phosphate isomerase/epimerase n=1 Tax=Edaphobacter modestus TaxID=388466 RepID=A0A4Q7YY79_9BACT|nr:sugar phosphate isomerase/epimerase family protein [Edaphobacter modestus]RZU42922.1 sugar phosphate isomerase/epimerase [Edaphobacter modestus]
MADLDRLSFNQMTAGKATLREVIDACRRSGIEWIGPWRHALGDDPAAVGRELRDAGLRVSSLCRGGMFPAATAADRRKRIDDNLRAIDEASAVGTDLLVLVNGPAPDKDIDAARCMVVDGIAAISDHAEKSGVRLGVEPLHPMFAADRSVIVTLGEANRIAEQFPSRQVGLVVDVYHVWWDPEVYREIARAGERIFAFHVSDWIVPLPDPLMGRGLMGEGVIEIRRLRQAVEAAGYRGPIEVEIFNEPLWARPADEIVGEVAKRFQEWV